VVLLRAVEGSDGEYLGDYCVCEPTRLVQCLLGLLSEPPLLLAVVEFTGVGAEDGSKVMTVLETGITGGNAGGSSSIPEFLIAAVVLSLADMVFVS